MQRHHRYPPLRFKKLRLIEVRSLFQGHRTNRWQSQNLKADLTPKSKLLAIPNCQPPQTNWGPREDLKEINPCIFGMMLQLLRKPGKNCPENFLFPHFSERIIWKIQSVPKNTRENAKEYKNGKFTLPQTTQNSWIQQYVKGIHLSSFYLPEYQQAVTSRILIPLSRE